MEAPTFEAPPMGTLGTLTYFKVLLGVLTLSLPPTATLVDEEGTVGSEGGAPSAVARAAALGLPISLCGTL